jgi:chromate transport protein ChrA
VFVLLGARYVEQVRNNPSIQAFLSGVSAAVVGVILVVSIDIARAAIVGIPSVVLAVVAFVSIAAFKVDVAKVAASAIAVGILYAATRMLSL